MNSFSDSGEEKREVGETEREGESHLDSLTVFPFEQIADLAEGRQRSPAGLQLARPRYPVTTTVHPKQLAHNLTQNK